MDQHHNAEVGVFCADAKIEVNCCIGGYGWARSIASRGQTGVCPGPAVAESADRRLTRRLRDALSLLDIRTLDHFVIGGVDAVSFAERGLL